MVLTPVYPLTPLFPSSAALAHSFGLKTFHFPFFAQVRRRVSDNPLLHLFCFFLSTQLLVGLIASALEHLSLFSKTSSFASFEFWKCFSETCSVKSAKLHGKVVIWYQTRSSEVQCKPMSLCSLASSKHFQFCKQWSLPGALKPSWCQKSAL